MPFWVTIRDGNQGEKTLVSHASSESGARTEAEQRGMIVDDIARISADLDSAELAKYEHLSLSRIAAFQVFCLTAGQVASILSCVLTIPLTVSTAIGASDTSQTIEVSLMVLLAGTLLFCTFASLFIVFAFVKRQLRS